MALVLTAADRLSLSFMALLGLVTLFFLPSPASRAELLAGYFLLAAALTAIAMFRNRPGSGNAAFYLHVGFTVVMVLMLFNSLGSADTPCPAGYV